DGLILPERLRPKRVGYLGNGAALVRFGRSILPQREGTVVVTPIVSLLPAALSVNGSPGAIRRGAQLARPGTPLMATRGAARAHAEVAALHRLADERRLAA
ncbi:MAG TPA: hypothetical protein VHK63_05220, partial [Candidatus Limnocylindria bacterium]|nr:hypothetical protein [Candidatus Limnocylindria bacterium]